MINYNTGQISPLAIHHIGRALEGEDLKVMDNMVSLKEDEYLEQLVFHYLLSKFKEPSFYNFDALEGESNRIQEIATSIFEEKEGMLDRSKELAHILYKGQEHPNIKTGALVVCHFEDILVEDELLEAVGIFKIESKAAFLQLDELQNAYKFKALEGLAMNGLDKGCLILNTEKADGYKVCVLDKTGVQEARFWKNTFLNLKERKDEYHNTTHYINLTNDFVNDRQKSSPNPDGMEKLEVMNASEKYFNSNDSFNENEYLDSLFGDEQVAQDFQDYKSQVAAKKGYDLGSDFGISDAAVKKQSKVFKSVIKLDKNFHIYVHGDRTKIERGQDDFGRKFYKVYYEEEH